MSTRLNTVRDVVAEWPSRKCLAEELDVQGFKVSLDRIHKWVQSDAIPAKYHKAIVLAGNSRGLNVTTDLLASIHHRPDDEADTGIIEAVVGDISTNSPAASAAPTQEQPHDQTSKA